MNRHKKIVLTGWLVLLLQIYIFYDYIGPIQWGQVKVSGLACTCPDETVVNGSLYLRAITPDSLRKYNLDYSEIYVTERPYVDIDLMGVDLYMIKGQIIGKKRVSEFDPWNPVFRVDKWWEVDILKDWGVKILFFGQIVAFLVVLGRTQKQL